jgi:ankyrin repeat protein
MLRALETIASPALELSFTDTNLHEEPHENLTYADILDLVATVSKPIIPTDMHEKTALRSLEAATQVAEYYSVGINMDQDLATARKWLTISGRAGNIDHAIYFSVIDDALGNSPLERPEVVLRSFWLVLTASGGCVETLRILKEQSPSLYNVAKSIKRKSGGILRNVRDPEAVVGRLFDRMDTDGLALDYEFGPLGYTILHYAVAVGYAETVQGLLGLGTNVNATDYTGSTPLDLAATCGNGKIVDILLKGGADSRVSSTPLTPLHLLSFVEDEFLDSIVEPMVRDASQLAAISPERRAAGLENPFQSLKGTPLQWAARKPNERLFIKLLDLHIKFSVMPADLDEILRHLAQMNLFSMLGAIISLVPKLRSSELPLDSIELDNILSFVGFVPDVRLVMIHRGTFNKAPLATVNVLLEAGADPFRLSETQLGAESVMEKLRNFLGQVIVGDDLDVLERIISFGRETKLDLKPIFEDSRRFAGRNAFQRAIYSGSYRIFNYLAQSPYIDLECRSERGMTALHAAVWTDDPRYIDVLLRIGCDPYARSVDGRTPFQSAIYAKAFKSASRLLHPDACTPERLFGTTMDSCNPAGFTLFGSVLAASITNYRHVVDFTTLYYLDSVGAFTFVNNVIYNNTILNMIAVQYPSLRPDYASFERVLLDYILFHTPVPADIFNRNDDYGLTPLQWMVLRGNLSAITTLLTHPSSQNKIDINIETSHSNPNAMDPKAKELGIPPGETALSIALQRRREIPNLIKQGGQREMQQWGLRVEAIIDLLKEAGGRLGSRSSEMEEMELAGVTVNYPEDDIVAGLLAPLMDQRIKVEANSHRGAAWPLRLQRRVVEDGEGEIDEDADLGA